MDNRSRRAAKEPTANGREDDDSMHYTSTSSKAAAQKVSFWKKLALVLILASLLILHILSNVNRQNNKTQTLLRKGEIKKESSTDIVNTVTKSAHKNSECTVWIAPSSIKGHAGYGIYTTRDLTKGESIMGYADGISISVQALQLFKKWHRLWAEYWWEINLPDHSSYEAPNKVFDYIVGLGTFPNHHCVLGTLDYRYAKPPYDDTLVDRFSDPGTGAFSYNFGKEPFVYKNVPAGHEVFLNYGYCQRDRGHLPEWSDFVVMKEDFRHATIMMNKYIRGESDAGIYYDEDGQLVVTKKMVSMYTYELLPRTKSEYDAFMEQYKDKDDSSLLEHVAERSLHQRSVDWIQDNGMCMMNIVPKKSTLPHAGRGAFAQFAMKKGEIISPVPLIHMVDKKFSQQELIVNYCFRHSKSSMMLCPMSNSALMNHCSDRTKECKDGAPNAQVQWASDWDPTTKEWRTKTLVDLAGQHQRGLSFEIVALRDIEPGEEVFIDYGIEWEQAWANHVQHWTPPPRVKNFITAKEANDDGDGPIRKEFLSGDLRKTVDHPHLFTGCQYYYDDVDEHKFYKDKRVGDWTKMSDDQLLERFADNGRRYSDKVTYSRHEYFSYWPCTVIRQEAKPDLYTVRIHQSPFNDQTDWDVSGLPRILTGYHREGIHYFVQPYKSDTHLPGVFRHPIGIRDDMIPDNWKDLQ